jgi:peptidoglycan/LPS O-acetylase OafA/YrhL
MTALVIFGSTFVLVFALGFQSLNVNKGHYRAAFFTSFAIAVSNLVLFKTVPQANWLEIAAYLTAGPCAIVASMWAHRKWMTKRTPGPVPKPDEWPDPPESKL